MKIFREMKEVPISDIRSGIIKEKSLKIDDAIVAYFDVLGFSNKKNNKDVESTLFDFSVPLVLCSKEYPKIRFNVFSDCSFIAAPINNAREILSAIRFSFTQWISDGILVRGGISMGSYSETFSATQQMASENYTGSLFSESAVIKAVKLEDSGEGALLFTDNVCAKLYSEKYGEPIFLLEKQKVIGWTDDESVLYWFIVISFLRLLKFLSLKDAASNSTLKKLIHNLDYSKIATDHSNTLLWFLILAILSSPTVDKNIREKAIVLFQIKDPDDFIPLKKLIKDWLNETKKFELLKALADIDSSLP